MVGGLEHFVFSHILGIVIPIDFHIFQRGRLNHQPDLNTNIFSLEGCYKSLIWSDGLGSRTALRFAGRSPGFMAAAATLAVSFQKHAAGRI